MFDYHELEFKTNKKRPQIKWVVQPAFSTKDKDKALLILVAIAVAEGQDIEYSSTTVFLTFEIVSRVQPADPLLKTIVFPTFDKRIHFAETNGDPEALKTLIGRRFSARLIRSWDFQNCGQQIVGTDDDGEDVYDQLFATCDDWIIDIDTLELLPNHITMTQP